MKKSYQAIFSLVLTLLMVFGLAATAFAADSSITFNGFSGGFDFQPGSEYTETDLFDNFKNVMPGDTLTQTITFNNSATDCDFVNLYMRAEVHNEEGNPLSEKVAEEETVVTMTQFLSQLSMKVWNGTELIYEASPDELDGLKNNVFSARTAPVRQPRSKSSWTFRSNWATSTQTVSAKLTGSSMLKRITRAS